MREHLGRRDARGGRLVVGDDGGREGPEEEGGVGGQEAIAEQPAVLVGVYWP